MSNRLIGHYGDDGMRTINGQMWCAGWKKYIIWFFVESCILILAFLLYNAWVTDGHDVFKRTFSRPILYATFTFNNLYFFFLFYGLWRSRPILGDYFGYREDVKRLASILGHSIKKITESNRTDLESEIEYRMCQLLNKVKGQAKPGPTCSKAKRYWRLYKHLHILAQKFSFRVCGKFPNPQNPEAFTEFVQWCIRNPNRSASQYLKESDKPTEVER